MEVFHLQRRIIFVRRKLTCTWKLRVIEELSTKIRMAKPLFFFLVSVSSIVMVNGVIPTNELFQSLNDAGQVLHNFTMELIPYDLPLEETFERLVNSMNRVNALSYSFDWNVLDSLKNSHFELLKYGSPQNFREIVGRIIFFFLDIHVYYATLETYLQSIDTRNITSVDFFFKNTIENSQIEEGLKNIFRLVNGLISESPNLFSVIGDYMKNYKTGSCSREKLTQAHILSLYYMVFEVELKGTFHLVAAYTHLMRRRLVNFHYDVKSSIKRSGNRLKKYSRSAREAMKQAQLEILACDEETYVENENYIQLSGMSKGFLIDSGSLRPEVRDCQLNSPEKDSCASEPSMCFHKKCWENGGLLTQCRNLNGTRMEVCLSEENSRLYTWMKIGAKEYGSFISEQKCNGSLTEQSVKDERNENSNSRPYVPARFCFCNCEREKSELGDVRAISLKWELADYRTNRIITNLKFGEKNGLIRLEIETGLISKRGTVGDLSISWQKNHPPFPDIDPESNAPIYIFNQTYTGKPITLYKWIESRDFVYITKKLSINLDDIVAPKNHVIIGVRLTESDSDESGGTTIELQILSAEYDFATGILNPRNYSVISGSSLMQSKGYEFERERVDLGVPGNPARMKKNNTIISKPFQYVTFQQSDFKRDLGQSIVPFIDTRPLKTGPRVPLSGVGIYFRDCEKNCGGFIAPKLFLYNFTNDFEHDYEKNYLKGDKLMF